jgi:hypothetical protein
MFRDESLRAIAIRDRSSGDCRRHLTRWLFVCIGGDCVRAPNTGRADKYPGGVYPSTSKSK